MKHFTKSYLAPLVILCATAFTTQCLSQDVEPNDNIATASVLTLNSNVVGDLMTSPANDVSDYYEVVLDNNGELTASVSFDAGLTGRVYVYRKNGGVLATGTQVSGPNVSTVTVSCLAKDTVYVLAYRTVGGGTYTVSNSFTSPSRSEDVEPNNVIAEANVFLAPDEMVTGHLGYFGVGIGDSYDYYGLIAGDDGNITISATFDPTLTGRLYLYYKSGLQLGFTAATTGELSLSQTCLANDTIYALVYRTSGCGSYEMQFEVDTTPVHDQDIEPNNVIAEANVFLAPNETVDGRLGYEGVGIGDSYDYYGLIAGDDGNITISATFDPTLTGRLYLYYKSGLQLGFTAATTGELSLSETCLANDTIYALVYRTSGCGSYEMQFEVDTTPVHDQDIEPNNVIPEANVFLAPNETVDGRLGYEGVGIGDSYDYYGLIAGDDGNITISATFDPTLTGRLYLYYKSGLQLGFTAATTGELSLSETCLANDTIYALVYRTSGCGSYEMQFSTIAPTFANDMEPNNSIAESTPLPTADKVTGHLGYNGVGISDAYDYYSFEVLEAPFELDAKVIYTNTLNGRLYLYNAAGNQLGLTGVSTGEFNLTYTITVSGIYHLLAYRTAGCGSYQLGDICGLYPMVTATPEGPLNKCPDAPVELEATAGLAAYTWFNDGAVVGNTQLYAATSSGDYQVVGFDINGCPDTSAVVIITDIDCDDNDPCTDDFCDSIEGCSNIYSGDDDDDGTCNNLDLCPNDPLKIEPGNCGCGSPEPGASCDDGDETTENDTVTEDCGCEGTPIFDCPALMANVGDSCDDMDSATVGDQVQEDCSCAGSTSFDCPELMANIGDSCDDGDDCTTGDIVTDDCGCAGEPADDDIIIDCVSNQIVEGDASCQALLQDYTSDVILCENCEDVTLEQSPQPGASIFGSQEVTITASNGCSFIDNCTFLVSVETETIATYGSSFFCQGDVDPMPLVTGILGGVYTSIPAGLQIDEATGQIDLSETIAGTYVVTYIVTGDCATTSSVELVVEEEDEASFVYPAAAYCPDDSSPMPMVTGDLGGIFSSDADLAIDATTGEIDILSSSAGIYTVSYTTHGECPVTVQSTIALLTAEECLGGANLECESAIAVSTSEFGIPAWELFELDEVASAPGCAGNAAGDRWFSFVADAQNNVILAQDPNGNGDMVIEVYENCIDAPIGCHNSYGVGTIERASPGGLSIGTTYYFRVYEASGLAIQNVRVMVKNYVDGGLESFYCDVMNYQLNDVIYSERQSAGQLYSTPFAHVTDYQFKFEEEGGDFVRVVSSRNASYALALRYVNGLEYGKNYHVSVRHKLLLSVNGSIMSLWSPFGTPCLIGLQEEVPTTSLLDSYCVGDPLYMQDQIITTPVLGASAYRFTLTGGGQTFVRTLPVYNLLLFTVGSPGNRLQYGTLYHVSVEVNVGGNWSEPGETCTISMAQQPESVNVLSVYCGQDFEYPNSNFLVCGQIYGATEYEFRFTPQDGGPAFSEYSQVSRLYFHLVENEFDAGIYAIKVKALAGGQWSDYGDECFISVNGVGIDIGSTVPDAPGLNLEKVESTSQLDMQLYPNPNDGSKVKISFNTPLEIDGQVEIVLIDMTGKVVESHLVSMAKSDDQIDLVPLRYIDAGIYIVQLRTGQTTLEELLHVQ